MYDIRQRVIPSSATASAVIGWSPNFGTSLYSVTYNEEAGEVRSWRGKRRVVDSYGWIPPNEFELRKSSFVHGLSSIIVSDDDPPMGQLIQVAIDNGRYYQANVDQHALLCMYKLPEIQPDVNIPLADTFGKMGEHALKQAQAEAWDEANSPDCPGLTWIGESKETLIWIKDIVSGVLRATIKYKSGIRRLRSLKQSAEKTADRAASLWLQYRYAVTPLALQLEEAIGLLKDRKRELVTITSYTKRKKLVESTKRDFTWSQLHMRVTTEEYLDFRGACKLYPTAIRDSFDWGIQPYDVVLTALELTKLSFVLEWFIGIGTWLGSYRPGDAKIAYQSNTSIVNVIREVKTELLYHTYDPRFVEVSYVPEMATYTRTMVKRTTEVERPLLPAFNVEALSLMRQLDAVSLAFQMLKGFKKK